jgi:hypothetical protein
MNRLQRELMLWRLIPLTVIGALLAASSIVAFVLGVDRSRSSRSRSARSRW